MLPKGGWFDHGWPKVDGLPTIGQKMDGLPTGGQKMNGLPMGHQRVDGLPMIGQKGGGKSSAVPRHFVQCLPE